MKSLQGHILVAAATLIDPNFIHSVLLMVQHDDDGALGVIVNRPTQMPIGQVWEQVSDTPCACQDLVYHGGPCQGPLMVVHTRPDESQITIGDDLHFSTDSDALQRLVEEGQGPMKFFVGYAGWTAGQLEAELRTGSWLTTPAKAEHIFHDDHDQWKHLTQDITRAIALRGLNPKVIPKDPQMN